MKCAELVFLQGYLANCFSIACGFLWFGRRNKNARFAVREFGASEVERFKRWEV